MESLQAKHRKEQRDLQARITQKKKSATKKTRKGVNDECERLQKELLENQRKEISSLNGEGDGELPVNLDDLNLANEDTEDASKNHKNGNKTDTSNSTTTPVKAEESLNGNVNLPKKVNRHKARLARRAAEQDAKAAAAAEEATNQTDHRGNERKIMDDAFSRLKLTEREIRPDGHCLYSAVASQLVDTGMGLSPRWNKGQDSSGAEIYKDDGYRAVRSATAGFIMDHSDDFAPFLEEPIQEYTRKIKLTTEWGGQLELQAISRAYGVYINVIQGDGRIEKFEPGEDSESVDEPKTIWLAYYRHTYGLGEHYNALSKVP